MNEWGGNQGWKGGNLIHGECDAIPIVAATQAMELVRDTSLVARDTSIRAVK